MILMDFALTSSCLHYKIHHPNLEKKYTRSTFMEALQYQIIHVDWAKKVMALKKNDLKEDDDEDDTLSVDKHIDKELEIGIYALKKKTQEKNKWSKFLYSNCITTKRQQINLWSKIMSNL